MSIIKLKHNRRSFLKVSAASSGGLLLGFNWLASCTSQTELQNQIPLEWFNINAFLKIANDETITIFSPNPEIGQNVKTSMPMIVAEELDAKWENVRVEQAPLDTENYTRQVAGGSQSIRQGWKGLRTAGAAARKLLMNAAAQKWNVDVSQLTTSEGVISGPGGKSIKYGEIANEASSVEIPDEVELKNPKDFKIIGHDTPNVDLENIIVGNPLFGLDYKKEGMKYAVVLRPPAFGAKLKSFDDTAAKQVTGVENVVQFGDKIAVLANSTWAAIKGQRALTADWDETGQLESTTYHDKKLKTLLNTKADEPKREDGDVKSQFSSADKVFERTYEAPFLPHNCLEPMNFFADVTSDKVTLVGPIQTPERTRRQVAELLGRDLGQITIDMTRMGGGFGRRLYGDFVLEAAEISSLINNPVKVVYTREDDMTAGIYRPASMYKFKVGVKDDNVTAYHLVGAGINMRNSTRQNNFPAAAIENYLVESHNLESNITTGAWRAPITNFLAFAEQSFFDELAHEMGQDPVQLRLDLFEKAKSQPTGEPGYDPDKSMGVIKLAAEKSNWSEKKDGVHKGFSTYYSHNTYVAEVAEVMMVNNKPKVTKVTCAVDCGIVINPLGAKNQIEGGIIDGIGHALYGDFSFVNGKPQKDNFDEYRLIRTDDAPKIDIHFVESYNDPTGLGEPTLPPAGGAIANAIFAATGTRYYKQPFIGQEVKLG